MYAYLSWEEILLQCLDTRVGGGDMYPVPGWVHALVTMENPPYFPLIMSGGLHAFGQHKEGMLTRSKECIKQAPKRA